jgi:hypothetical protein
MRTETPFHGGFGLLGLDNVRTPPTPSPDLTPPTSMSTTNGCLELRFELPMPAVSLVELRPYDAAQIRPDH